jgi:2-keto-3-deoxy-L-rhamnonate aldolase RhmA
MQTPPNLFKQALLEKRPQIGYWLNLPNTLVGETPPARASTGC